MLDQSKGIEHQLKALFDRSNMNQASIESGKSFISIFSINSIDRSKASTDWTSWNLNFHKENSRSCNSILFILQMNTLQPYIIITICWSTNFWALISLAHSQKIPTQAHKLFWAHINISHTLLKYSPWYWAPTNISYIKLHKLPWALSQILPILSKLRLSTNNTYHITTKIGPQNYTISTKSPKSVYLWAKPKRAQQYRLLSPIWSGTSKAQYDPVPLKPNTIRHHLQSPLRCGISTKPIATWQCFYKILQSPNANLALFLQSPNDNLALFS